MGFKIRCAIMLAVMLLSNYECSADGGTGGTLNGDGGNEPGPEPEDHVNFAILKHPSVSFTLITSIFAVAF